MEYEDFRVTITSKVKEGNRVIIDSPAGSDTGVFVNPIDKSSFDDMLMNRGLKVRSLDDARSKTGLREIKPVEATDALDKMGNQLYRALFREQVLSLYAQSQGMVDEREHGLRVRIQIDPKIKEYSELTSLPWEFLCDETKRSRIELMENRAIVRDPITPAPVIPLKVKPPFKILAVASDPDDYPPLKLGRETRFLASMSQQVHGIEVKFLEKATIEALDEEMGKHEYHIFHFMGHG